jgi:hypothetical protein
MEKLVSKFAFKWGNLHSYTGAGLKTIKTEPKPGRVPGWVEQLCGAVHVVALQVAFERQTLKPVSHLIGYRLWV